MKIVRRTLADGTVKEYRYTGRRKARIAAGTLGALVQEYRRSPEFQALRPNTQKVYLRAIGHMHPLYQSAIADLKHRHVVSLRNAFAATPALADQIGRVFSILMQFAIEMEYRDSNPAARIGKLCKGEYERWSDGQVAFALEHLAERFRRAVLLALHTGQRAGDCVRMGWADYDGDGIMVAQEKTGAKLWIPCHAALRAELDAWKRDRQAVSILTDSKGHPWKHAGSFSTAFSSATHAHPELAGVVFHGLRKTAAAKLAEAGASTLEIAAITGHKTLSMIELYTRQADQRTRAKAAVVKLEKRPGKS